MHFQQLRSLSESAHRHRQKLLLSRSKRGEASHFGIKKKFWAKTIQNPFVSLC